MKRSARTMFIFVPLLAISLLGPASPAARRPPDKEHTGLSRLHGHESIPRAGAASDRLLKEHRNPVAENSSATFAADNFRFLSHLGLTAEDNADVFFYDHAGTVGKYTYVGNRCGGSGVKVINVNDPTSPRLVARVGVRAGLSNEDIVVRRIGARDVLAVGVQPCFAGRSGLRLFDVTKPKFPKRLGFLPVPSGGVHELDMVVRPDGRALALLAVPFVELGNTYFGANDGGEFRIVDVSDPTNPRELSDWGIIADSSLKIFGGNDEISSSFQGNGYFASFFAHSARAANHGMTAYVSYWDGGVLKFDISDPANPVLKGRTVFSDKADGDAHSMTPYRAGGKNYVLQNDEDFEALAPMRLSSSATGNKRFPGIEEPWMPTLLSDGSGLLSGNVFDAGDGCQSEDYRGARGKIVVADTVDPFYVDIIEGWTVPCKIGRQVLMAVRARAKAFVSNLVSPDDPYPFAPSNKTLQRIQNRAGDMVAVQIADIDEAARRIRRRLSDGAVKVTLKAGIPSWGYLRVFDESTATDPNGDGVGSFRQVGRFHALPHVRGEHRTPPGAWSIHNTEVRGNRAYSSWYSQGIVALNLTDPTEPGYKGQFVPPESLVWGVAIDRETGVVYASDIGSGLWIVKPTGPALPN